MAKRRIMDTAAELFADRGYGNVGVSEVGVTAGFGKGALYYHIRSKEDLLVSIIAEHMDRLIVDAHAALEGPRGTSARVRALTVSFVGLLMGNTPAMTVCYRDIHALNEPKNIQSVAELHAAYRQIWSSVFREGAEAGEHRWIDDLQVDALLAMYFAAVFWVRPELAEDGRAIVDTLSRTVEDTVMSSAQ